MGTACDVICRLTRFFTTVKEWCLVNFVEKEESITAANKVSAEIVIIIYSPLLLTHVSLPSPYYISNSLSPTHHTSNIAHPSRSFDDSILPSLSRKNEISHTRIMNCPRYPMRLSKLMKAICWLHFSTLAIALVSRRGPHLHSRSQSQRRDEIRISTALQTGKYSSFTLLATESSEFLDIAEETRNFSLLDFLPQRGRILPFRTRKLFHSVTESYVFQKKEPYLPLYTADDLRLTIDEEYEVKEVPLCLGNLTLDSDAEIEENAQTMVEVLSLAALHRLPKELALGLLKPITDATTKAYVDIFERFGWNAVCFPRGLALQLKRELRSKEQQKGWWKNAWNLRRREKRLQLEAAIAVAEAQRVQAPEVRSTSPRDEVLAKIEQQLSEHAIKPIRRKDELLFFPNSMPLKSFSLRQFRRFAKRQYSMLKRKGRAGVLSYCVFNLLFYTMGMAWQWQRIAPADPLTTSSSITMVMVRKFARVFASLYVAAQLIKIPKVFGAIALAPYAQRVTDVVSKKLKVSQNVALVVLMSLMVVSWAAVIGALILGDYAKLRQLVLTEEHLIGLLSLQPV